MGGIKPIDLISGGLIRAQSASLAQSSPHFGVSLVREKTVVFVDGPLGLARLAAKHRFHRNGPPHRG